MAERRYIVGIDLGTTNSAVAYVDTAAAKRVVETFPIPQRVDAATTEARETLPSFHYQPAEAERAGAFDGEDHVVGFYARDRGAEVPGRLVASAKSWLSHAGVDRTADLLPWHGAPDVTKVSPTEVSARLLAHVRRAWNDRHPDHLLEAQDVVITVPASFDEIARELTVEAATRAGLPRVVLLEEPQAAFYAWMDRHQDETAGLRAGQRILVCDIGGGTTDFTLIEVRTESDGLTFHRVAVGDHLILGGDNLDLALAHYVEEKLGAPGDLEPHPWSVLVRKCQRAKESLLGDTPPSSYTLALPARGTNLVGGAQQVELTHDEVHALLVEGFLPEVEPHDTPVRHASGFREFGLPYAADSAITRYLAAFLREHGPRGREITRPDYVLLNGGFFESASFRHRLLDQLSAWYSAGETWAPGVLRNDRLDLAVARGAVVFGLSRRGEGARVRGGLARSYYIGVESDHGTTTAVCMAQAGLEPGKETSLSKRTFNLRVREPVQFPIYCSSTRTNDQPGSQVVVNPLEMTSLPPLRTVLKAGRKAQADAVRAELHALLTEIGTLELWCREVDGTRSWRLQFDVRATVHSDSPTSPFQDEVLGHLDEKRLNRCRSMVCETFAARSRAAHPAGLVKRLEEVSSTARAAWRPSMLRALWETLMQNEHGRALGPDCEARWMNLAGFCLRPGYGCALDDWRVLETWRLFREGVRNKRNEMCRAEWWVLWRRIAGGLTAGQQRALAEPLLVELRNDKPKTGSHERAEMWRLLASLEWMNTQAKEGLGDLASELVSRKGPKVLSGAPLWALARLGARVPAYGPLNQVVPVETVGRWRNTLCSLERPSRDVVFAVLQMSRRTGDRYRDIPRAARQASVDWLSLQGAPEHYVKLVAEGGELTNVEQTLVFGDALPLGLQVVAA